MTWLDWGEYLTKWVWNIHMILEKLILVKNDEDNIEKCSIKKCENSA